MRLWLSAPQPQGGAPSLSTALTSCHFSAGFLSPAGVKSQVGPALCLGERWAGWTVRPGLILYPLLCFLQPASWARHPGLGPVAFGRGNAERVLRRHFPQTGRKGFAQAHTGLMLPGLTPQTRHSNLGPMGKDKDHSVSACPCPDPRISCASDRSGHWPPAACPVGARSASQTPRFP